MQMGNVNTSVITLKGENNEKPHREKSVNDARNELREPFQRDLIGIPSVIPDPMGIPSVAPDLYRAFPRIISGPLECNERFSRRKSRSGKREEQKERQGEVEPTAMRIWVE